MTEILETQIDTFTKADARNILEDIEVEIMDVELEHSRQENVVGFVTFAVLVLLLIVKGYEISRNFGNCRVRKLGTIWLIRTELKFEPIFFDIFYF